MAGVDALKTTRWVMGLAVSLVLMVSIGCGAGQGGASGSRLSNEAGTNVLDRDGDGLNDDRVFVGHETGRTGPPPERSEVCGDGEDNDGDLDVDCDDAECAVLPSCAE